MGVRIDEAGCDDMATDVDVSVAGNVTRHGKPLTYAANWYREFEETDIWRYLDYISVQCYFPLTKKEKPTIDEIIKGWQPHLKTIEAVSKKYNKPVLLADAARIKWMTEPGEFTPNDGDWYSETLESLYRNPGCIGAPARP